MGRGEREGCWWWWVGGGREENKNGIGGEGTEEIGIEKKKKWKGGTGAFICWKIPFDKK